MKKNHGFSLIELTLALALITAAMLGLFAIYQNIATSSSKMDQKAMANFIAKETMEKIIAQKDCDESGCGYDAVLSQITSGTFNEDPVSGYNSLALSTSYYEVDPDDDPGLDDFLDASPGSGYARVTVQVSFKNDVGRVQLETLLADY